MIKVFHLQEMSVVKLDYGKHNDIDALVPVNLRDCGRVGFV